jgi:hypothetical protein
MKNYNLILSEDDSAPDARIYFSEHFKKETGTGLWTFMMLANRTDPNEMTIQYTLNEYQLEYSGDDPFYKLYELKDRL